MFLPNRVSLYTAIFTIAVMCLPIVCQAQQPTIFRIDARGKTSEIIGQELGDQIKQKFPDFCASIDASLMIVVGTLSTVAPFDITPQDLFDDIFKNFTNDPSDSRVDQVFEVVDDMRNNRIDPGFVDEANAVIARLNSGLATPPPDVLGDGLLSNNEFWLYQMSFDVLRFVSCTGFGAFGSVSTLGSPIVGRNLDITLGAPALLDMTAITVYQKEDRDFVNVGFAGLLCTVTGFSDIHPAAPLDNEVLFGAIIDATFLGELWLDSGRSSVPFDLRYALENCTEIGTRVGSEGDVGIHTYMKDKKYLYNHSLLLADLNQVVVQEHPKGKTTINNANLPGRLRTYDSPTTVGWRSKSLPMIAVTNRFVLPPAFPFECTDCLSMHCFSNNIQEPEIAEYFYYSEQTDDCIDPHVDCWEFCSKSSPDYWPGNPKSSVSNFDINGYYPLYNDGVDLLNWYQGIDRWKKLVQLADFTPNSQSAKASIKEVADIMTNYSGADPILSPNPETGEGNFITIQSMVFVPEQRRFFMYLLPSDIVQHLADPIMQEIGVLVPLKGDADGNGFLELDDVLICMQAMVGLSPQGMDAASGENSFDGKFDLSTAINTLQGLALSNY